MDNGNYTPNYDSTPVQADTDMTVGSRIITLILTCIPVVNLICLIVWAVSSSPEKRARKNWAIAQLIISIVIVVISIVMVACLGVGAAATMY